MSDTSIASSPRGSGLISKLFSNHRLNVILGWALPALIVLAGFLYWILPTLLNPPAPENAPMPVSTAIEAQYGIRITRIAVTADGGLIDFHYIILDTDKAHNFALDPASTPKLYPQTGNAFAFQTAPMAHDEQTYAGEGTFLLYTNATGAIKSRTYITVVLGDLKLQHVPVR